MALKLPGGEQVCAVYGRGEYSKKNRQQQRVIVNIACAAVTG